MYIPFRAKKIYNFFYLNFSNALICNVLEVMMSPNFEPPAHTLTQILERNISWYGGPYGAESWKEFFSKSENPEMRAIAETMVFTNSWDHYDNITKYGLLREGTHAQLKAYLWYFEYPMGREYNQDRGFYRGEMLPPYVLTPFASYFTSLTWHLNEEFKNLKDKYVKEIIRNSNNCPLFLSKIKSLN